jgi:TetR/AcrR family transcriptional repressor of multidrug resistance operon
MVELVAERGIHGTSMSQVAERAGVATGTAYVHYQSKEDLLIAAFVEVKTRLGESALAEVDLAEDPRVIFERVWLNTFRHLAGDPSIAEFLLQVEASPLRVAAHEALPGDDPLSEMAHGLSSVLVDLPTEVLYDLSLAPVVRLVASGTSLSDREVDTLIESCWHAIHRLSS